MSTSTGVSQTEETGSELPAIYQWNDSQPNAAKVRAVYIDR